MNKIDKTLKRMRERILLKSRRIARASNRALRHAIYKSQLSRLLRKHKKLGIKKSANILRKSIVEQIQIRPRLRLGAYCLLILVVALLVSAHASQKVYENEAEIKVGGKAVLVAEQFVDKAKDEEVSGIVASKISPFTYTEPVEEGIVSQSYASYHRGIDIATKLGSAIKPIGSGTVEFTGYSPDGKGNIVVVNHGDGLKTLYAHMGKIEVGVGNQVNSDTVLGEVGLTGRTTGAHLHLEVYDRDVAMNPAQVLP